MKLSRKILSLVLALVMVMGLAATAFAEGGGETTTKPGRITIENALNGETYNAYQILYLESYDAEKKNICLQGQFCLGRMAENPNGLRFL